MVPKVEILQHVNDVVIAILVFLSEVVEYADLHQSRMMESLFVPDDLDGDVLVGHVIERSDDLSEATLSDNFQNFVSVADVIVQNLDVATTFVVVAAVLRASWFAMNFARVQTQIPNLRVLLYFVLFELCQAVSVQLESVRWCHRKAIVFPVIIRRPLIFHTSGIVIDGRE
jgi:hypothetical protein